MPNEVVNTASAFVIRELSGEARTVRLVGRALPYRPFELSGTQRTELTWYPGNPEASLTVLGAAEDSTTINGMWKDKFLGDVVQTAGGNSTTAGANVTAPFVVDGEQVSTARRAAAVIDAIRRQGQPVEVTWDEQARRGVLKKFEQRWYNAHDLEWSITFEWTGFAETAPNPTVTQETSVADTASLMTLQRDALLDAGAADFPLTVGFAEDLNARLTAISDAVDQAASASASLTAEALTPADAARRTIAVTNTVVVECRGLVARLYAAPPRALINTAAPLGSLSLGATVASLAYVRGLVAAARALERTAVVRRTLLAEAVESDLLAVHAAREGEDLRDVAARYYGSRLQWQRLLAFNVLRSSELARGQVVLVPRATAGGA